MRKRVIYLALIGSLLIASLAGASFLTSTEANEGSVEPIRKVTIMSVSKMPVTSTSNLSGTLEAYEEVNVSFEIPGLVEETNFEVGDSVNQNQILSRLDRSNYELMLEKANTTISAAEFAMKQASASIAASDASVMSADAQVSSATASLNKVLKGARQQNLEQARSRVERAQAAFNKIQTDTARVETLYSEGLVARSEHEQAQLALINAAKDLEDAQNALSLLEEGATQEERESAEAAVQQANSAKNLAIANKEQAEAAKKQASSQHKQALLTMKEAELSLSKTILQATISGVILNKWVNVGELYSPGQAAYTIGQIDKLKVLLPVPDHAIGKWTEGQIVQVSLYDDTREGLVKRIYPITNNGTGSVNVEVIIDNPDKKWRPGQVVKAGLVSQPSEQIFVPAQTVLSNGNERYVYRVVEQRAVKTPVTVGKITGNKLEITDGLSVGDVIVKSGANLLYDGLQLQWTEESK